MSNAKVGDTSEKVEFVRIRKWGGGRGRAVRCARTVQFQVPAAFLKKKNNLYTYRYMILCTPNTEHTTHDQKKGKDQLKFMHTHIPIKLRIIRALTRTCFRYFLHMDTQKLCK